MVLVGARRAGNVGLVARAMWNTGLSRLTLAHSTNHLSKTALTFGAPAKEILMAAKTQSSLRAALKDSCFAIGFTRRVGKMRPTLINYLDLIPSIIARAKTGNVHLVFGNERTGLSTEQKDQCDAAAFLPSNPNFSFHESLTCHDVGGIRAAQGRRGEGTSGRY